MGVAKGAILGRHQTVGLVRAGKGGHLFMVKAWHSAGSRRRWVTIAYKPTEHEAIVYAKSAAAKLGDTSVGIFYGKRKIRQWKKSVHLCCPSCGWRGTVALERTKGGGH